MRARAAAPLAVDFRICISGVGEDSKLILSAVLLHSFVFCQGLGRRGTFSHSHLLLLIAAAAAGPATSSWSRHHLPPGPVALFVRSCLIYLTLSQYEGTPSGRGGQCEKVFRQVVVVVQLHIF